MITESREASLSIVPPPRPSPRIKASLSRSRSPGRRRESARTKSEVSSSSASERVSRDPHTIVRERPFYAMSEGRFSNRCEMYNV